MKEINIEKRRKHCHLIDSVLFKFQNNHKIGFISFILHMKNWGSESVSDLYKIAQN